MRSAYRTHIASCGRGRRVDAPGVRADAVAHLPGEVEVLQDLEDAHALGGVVPAAGRGEVGRERLLAGVPERRVADVVAERDRLGERLVERQGGGERTRDLGHLERVRQARDVVVALGVDETWVLCLRRRNALQWRIRSRSRSKAVRIRRAARGARGRATRPTGGRPARAASAPRPRALAGAQDECGSVQCGISRARCDRRGRSRRSWTSSGVSWPPGPSMIRRRTRPEIASMRMRRDDDDDDRHARLREAPERDASAGARTRCRRRPRRRGRPRRGC